MPKIDLRKELKPLYTASSKKAALVDIPRMKFLMVDGSGHPDGNPLFQQSMEALCSDPAHRPVRRRTARHRRRSKPEKLKTIIRLAVSKGV